MSSNKMMGVLVANYLRGDLLAKQAFIDLATEEGYEGTTLANAICKASAVLLDKKQLPLWLDWIKSMEE